MSTSINLYPVLTEEQMSRAISSPANLDLFYYDNGVRHYLHLENKTGDEYNFTAELRDPKCDWYPETHELQMQRSITIDNPSSWFGKEGVAPQDATIGVAQQWISVKAELRGIIPMGEFRKADNNLEFHVEYLFPQNTLQGSLILRTIIYLKKSGNISKDEESLCAKTGTILGEVDCCEIYVDGNGSVFPIATINDPSQPLWMVYFDDTADPMQDAFDQEHVEIRLNRAHPSFEQLKIESSLKESPLFLEVISSALMIIIDSAKDLLGPDWENVVSGQSNYVHGSIAEAIHYFAVKLGWDFSSSSKLAQSIHGFFDSNLQGGRL